MGEVFTVAAGLLVGSMVSTVKRLVMIDVKNLHTNIPSIKCLYDDRKIANGVVES